MRGNFGSSRYSLRGSKEIIADLRLTVGVRLDDIKDQGVATSYDGLLPFPPCASIGAKTFVESRVLDSSTAFAKLSYKDTEIGFYSNKHLDSRLPSYHFTRNGCSER